MSRPGVDRRAWWLPAVAWAAGVVVIAMAGFGVATNCTTSRPEAECHAIDDWAVFGVVAAGLVALLPVSRVVREQVRLAWIVSVVGALVAVTVVATYLV